MAWRTVYLEQQTKLWLSRNNLCFYHDEAELSIPIEDIDTLIIMEQKSPQISLMLLRIKMLR